jgi:hypothetical protein
MDARLRSGIQLDLATRIELLNDGPDREALLDRNLRAACAAG